MSAAACSSLSGSTALAEVGAGEVEATLGGSVPGGGVVLVLAMSANTATANSDVAGGGLASFGFDAPVALVTGGATRAAASTGPWPPGQAASRSAPVLCQHRDRAGPT